MTASSTPVHLDCHSIGVGSFFSVNFQRTLRLPDDGHDYPLPPGFGRFPLRAVADSQARCPASWVETGGFVLPMYRHEAMWLSFECPHWHPVAVRVEVGGVCALTGAHGVNELSDSPQNYMVVPGQPWLDGIKSGVGIIRQFVAAPLGDGVTIEEQVTGAEAKGGIQITVVEPKAGRFPNEAPRRRGRYGESGLEDYVASMQVCESATPMGLGAGGRMVQKIYPDEYGIDTWDAGSATTVNVRLVDASNWRAIIGEEPPPSPIPVATYKGLGLPWFALADHELADLSPSKVLAGVKSVVFD